MILYSDNSERLTPHWSICMAMVLLLGLYNVVCHVWGGDIRLSLPENDRVFIRSCFYVLAIVLFPLTNLMRHILLRLNQTMPGDKPAARRYLTTVIVTQCMVATAGMFGLLMFILGDEFNTLYIFTLMGALGIYLHRPRWEELQSIVLALSQK